MDVGRSRSASGVVALGIGCLIAVAVTACGQSAGAQRPAHFALRTPLKIGYSVYDLADPYWQSYGEGIQAEPRRCTWASPSQIRRAASSPRSPAARI